MLDAQLNVMDEAETDPNGGYTDTPRTLLYAQQTARMNGSARQR